MAELNIWESKSKYFIFNTSENSKYGVIDRNKNIVVEQYFNWAIDTNNHAIWFDVFKDENNSVYISSIEKKLDFIFLNSIEEFFANRFEIGDDYTNYPDVYLYYNESLRRVIVPNFDESKNLVFGNNWFFTGGKFGLVSKDGTILIPPTFDLVHLYSTGLALVVERGKNALIDIFGRIIIPFTANMIGEFDNYEFLVWEGNKNTKLRVEKKNYWQK